MTVQAKISLNSPKAQTAKQLKRKTECQTEYSKHSIQKQQQNTKSEWDRKKCKLVWQVWWCRCWVEILCRRRCLNIICLFILQRLEFKCDNLSKTCLDGTEWGHSVVLPCGETREPGQNSPGDHKPSRQGLEPGPQWWETRVLTSETAGQLYSQPNSF